MLEKDIQDYLYDNPAYIFNEQKIQEKSKEYYIKGKRIDILFRVDNVRYIIEVKNRRITREDIGQVIEYYGLMKEYLDEANLKMILVSPLLEKWQISYLEELGIRCILFDSSLITQSILGNNNATLVERKSTKSKINYWFVYIDFRKPLHDLCSKRYDELKHLFKHSDSKLNVIHILKSWRGTGKDFARRAKEGDFAIINMNMNSNLTVYPPRRIILIEEVGDNLYFYFETTKVDLKNTMSFDKFAYRLSKINSNITIKSTSVKSISKYIKEYKKMWENTS